MQGMIDWHSHILPGIDDGSRDVEMSLEMLRESRRQGVGLVVATPHFYPDEDALEYFFTKREASYALLQKAIRQDKELQKMEIRLGCELAWYPEIGSMSVLEQFLVEGTRLLLVEMPFQQWTHSHILELQKIIDRGIIPVIAHIERYLRYQKDRSYLERILKLPLILQFNGGPLLAGGLMDRAKRAKIVRFMEESRYFVLGSDMHNTKTRPQNLQQARKTLEKLLPGRKLRRMDALGEKYFH